ncbi:MAG TPA: thiamine pyrophosphate-dependent enzyme [Acidobacteriaceae bacterium]
MADNPLLPQNRLRELHALIDRIRQMDRRKHTNAREALLGATLIHLSKGDLVSGRAEDATLRAFAPESSAGDEAHQLPANLRLPLCAGAARGMQTAGTYRLAVAFAEAATPEPLWVDALRWAHRDRLPMLLIVADDGAARSHRGAAGAATPLTWPELTKLSRSLQLPHFPVDGEDAVAVFRVMQETSARARSGGGPSVLWAMLSSERPTGRQQPLRRLEAYMAGRGIEV